MSNFCDDCFITPRLRRRRDINLISTGVFSPRAGESTKYNRLRRSCAFNVRFCGCIRPYANFERSYAVYPVMESQLLSVNRLGVK